MFRIVSHSSGERCSYREHETIQTFVNNWSQSIVYNPVWSAVVVDSYHIKVQLSNTFVFRIILDESDKDQLILLLTHEDESFRKIGYAAEQAFSNEFKPM